LGFHGKAGFRIFAPVNPSKRRISALFLLSVVLPIVFLAPFHHHIEQIRTDISCKACAHHQSHPGHLSEETGTNECLICQLLAQHYVPSADLTVHLLSSDIVDFVHDGSDDVIVSPPHLSSPRAPPASFCS
jgi:hypothetical protein